MNNTKILLLLAALITAIGAMVLHGCGSDSITDSGKFTIIGSGT